MRKYTFLLIIAVVAACGPKNVPTTSSTSDINRYQEDLSKVRPTYTAEITQTETGIKPETPVIKGDIVSAPVKTNLDVTNKLEVIMDTISVRNKNIRYAQGYRIQIYSGNDRKEAEAAKAASYQLFPDITPYLIYAQPVYRVKAGDFLDRIEAEKYYVGFKAKYPTAIVVPDKVDIRKNASGN
jgi:hypothetical protein